MICDFSITVFSKMVLKSKRLSEQSIINNKKKVLYIGIYLYFSNAFKFINNYSANYTENFKPVWFVYLL